jgi:hypothetical protein
MKTNKGLHYLHSCQNSVAIGCPCVARYSEKGKSFSVAQLTLQTSIFIHAFDIVIVVAVDEETVGTTKQFLPAKTIKVITTTCSVFCCAMRLLKTTNLLSE